MWGMFLKTILILLAIVGLTEIFRLLSFRFLRTRNRGTLYWVISFSGHDEEAELALKNALVLCVDRGMDEETRKVCRIISSENLDVHICKPEELAEILEQ